ncbi:hypothetical protein J2T14_005691 [Paenibacillus harenae]|nr:hypothetical protein [Paenibacillus harenae]MDQ0063469.1 hypothetical protein [Paenibacillus harenae]
MYASLKNFDDKAVQDLVTIPKLAFAGEQDSIVYGNKFGGVTVDIIGLLRKNKALLEQLGWDVVVLTGDDMDHTKAMQPATALPLIKPWLADRL